MELEVSKLHNIYWKYKAGVCTENDLIIAYNIFMSSTGRTLYQEDT